MAAPSKPKKPPHSPLHLTIRFSHSLPDLSLDIPNPADTTVLSLKYLLRTRLSTPNRLRLIHQGRLLHDASALSSVIKTPPPPPPKSSVASSGHVDDDDDDGGGGKGKGKGVAGKEVVRVYVNCSIGDELSEEELEKEKVAAEAPPSASDDNGDPSGKAGAEGSSAPKTSTRPAPRGFDRLLSSGFTHSEIATLRTQFSTIHASHYPPDAPPSPDTLRSMEDSWIDSNAGESMGSGGGGAAGGGFVGEDGAGLASDVDVLVRAMVLGFFFPLGSFMWLLRVEGLWSEGSKWKIFVLTGCLFSVLTGLIMSLSGAPVSV